MTIKEDQIYEIVEHIWTSFVGLHLKRHSSCTLSHDEDYYLIASLHIEGAWQGEVALVCSEGLAYRVTAHLFEINEDAVTWDEVKDALGELSNMIGGNMKQLLPEPSRLMLPIVGYDEDVHVSITLPEHGAVPTVLADCEDHPLLVMLADHTQMRKRIIHER